jgi:hypothetical protein
LGLRTESVLVQKWVDTVNNANQGLKNHVAAGGLKKDASNI